MIKLEAFHWVFFNYNDLPSVKINLASTICPTQAKIPKYLGEKHWRGG
jgi:hypothetical protein